tara:strand:+ start:48 stop:557 length:510 start_codon:yes stop_codon:yes gene_type:complete
MSYLRHTSRGRTKQPKNLALDHVMNHPEISAGGVVIHASQHWLATGSVGICTSAADLYDNLTPVGLDPVKTVGYDTQNQQYLHIMMDQGTSAARTVSVFGYNRVFGRWANLKIPLGEGASVDAMYVNCDIVSDASTTTMFVIPIHGIDRVAFVGGTTTGLTLYAAGSSF